MTTILDRYAGAVYSGNLLSKPDTTYSDSDVLAAAGLAARNVPLSMALLRLLCGDNRATREIIAILARGVVTKAWRCVELKLPQVEAEDMARSVLAWSRNNRCTACGGHGFKVIQGAPSLSDQECQVCHGTARRPFDVHFRLDRLDLARWMLAEVEREVGYAGPAAMAKLAPRLDF